MSDDDEDIDDGLSDEDVQRLIERHRSLDFRTMSDSRVAMRPMTKGEISLLTDTLFSLSGGLYEILRAIEARDAGDKEAADAAISRVTEQMRECEADIARLWNGLYTSLISDGGEENE